jgi:hypothetical protein
LNAPHLFAALFVDFLQSWYSFPTMTPLLQVAMATSLALLFVVSLAAIRLEQQGRELFRLSSLNQLLRGQTRGVTEENAGNQAVTAGDREVRST